MTDKLKKEEIRKLLLDDIKEKNEPGAIPISYDFDKDWILTTAGIWKNFMPEILIHLAEPINVNIELTKKTKKNLTIQDIIDNLQNAIDKI